MENAHSYFWESSGAQTDAFLWVFRVSNNRIPSEMRGLSLIPI